MASSPVAIHSQGNDARPDNTRFIEQLKSIVGPRHVLTNPESTLRYRMGFRFGNGPALAVVRPGNLVEQWRVLKACVASNKIILMQAANTGLTGGSTPVSARCLHSTLRDSLKYTFAAWKYIPLIPDRLPQHRAIGANRSHLENFCSRRPRQF
jgi:hypothetical protein